MNTRDYGAATHVGRVREKNEDYYYADGEAGIWLIADGMGGHQSGEIASATVGEYIPRAIREGTPVKEAISSSHKAIFDAVEKGQGAFGMGTTVVVLKVIDNAYEIAWVGDSRAYLWDGSLHLLTRDHSLVQRLLDAGAINAEEARDHPQRNRLTNVLGAAGPLPLKVDSIEGTLKPGESILLCSDGLSAEVSEEQIATVLSRPGNVQKKVDRLIEIALNAGGSDNVTVLLIPAEEMGYHLGDTAPRKMTASTADTSKNRHQSWVWLSATVILAIFIVWFWLMQNP